MQPALLRRKIAAAAVSAPPVERVSDALSPVVADLFGAQWALQDVVGRAIAAADAPEAVGDSTCFAFEGDVGAGLAAFDERAIIAAADRALGRSPSPGAAQSTHVDRMLSSGAAQRLLGHVLEVQGLRAQSLRMLTIGAGADAAKLLKGVVFVYRLAIASPDGADAFSISVLATAPATTQARGETKTMRDFGETAARAAKTALRVEIGVITADIGAAMRLAKDDILHVDMLASARLTAGDGASVIALGKAGEADGARALRLGAAARS